MKCKKCGKEYNEGQKFCKGCGANLIEQQNESTTTENEPTDKTEETVTKSTDENVNEQNTEQSNSEGQSNDNSNEDNQGKENQNTEQSSSQEVQVIEPSDITVISSGDDTVSSTGKKKKGIIKFAIGACAIILCIFLIKSLFGGKKPNNYASWSYFSVDETGDEVLYNNDGKVYSVDSSNTTLRNGVQNENVFTLEDDTLYVYGQKDRQKVSSDVAYFYISCNENKVLYIKDVDEDEDIPVGDLYIYDVKSKKSKKIDDEVIADGTIANFGVTISPNGKAVSYIKNVDEDEETFDVYISKNSGKGKKVDTNKLILAMSDDADIKYYFKVESDIEDFYASHNKSEIKVSMDSLSDVNCIFLTNNAKQMIISCGDKSYIIENGKKIEKIKGSITSIFANQQQFMPNGNTIISYVGVDSIFDRLMSVDNEEFISINKKLAKVEYDKFETDNTQYATSIDDGKTIITMADGELVKYNMNKPKKVEKLSDDDNVTVFAVSENGKDVYYINEKDTLYYSKNGDDKKVASDVNAASIFVNNNGEIYFTQVNDEGVNKLYCSKKGGEKKLVDNGKNIVDTNFRTGEYFFRVTNDDGDESTIYMVTKSNKSKEIKSFN